MNAHAFALILALAAAGPAWAGGRDAADVALAQASTAVAAAERAGALQESAPDFAAARDNLLLAQAAYDARDYDDAIRASHRAHADARLAEARARQHKAEAATAQLQAALDTLRAEMAR